MNFNNSYDPYKAKNAARQRESCNDMISSSVFNSENDKLISHSSSSNQFVALGEDSKNCSEEYERMRRIESAMQHEGKASW